MRLFSLFLIITLLLAGCSPAQPAVSSEITLPAPTEAETFPTEPAADADPMDALLASMTVEEKVGQLFLARCPAEGAQEDLLAYHLGGYLLFGQDFDNKTPDSLKQTLDAWQCAAPIPLLIAVDEEGGTVCRISSYSAFRSRRFPSPRESYTAGGMEQVLSVETEKALLLSGLGINVNMGPVCDISTNAGAFMYERSLGQSPEETARFVSATVQIYGNHGLGSVLKHFPGYGSNADTHTDIITDSRSLEELEAVDLLPFAAGISAGADAILVSHNIVTAMDAEFPASLSPAVHDYLRSAMGFEGVIVTDDLVMEAITKAYGPEEAAVLAVLAGNDLLCSSEYQIQYPAVLGAVRSGRISTEQLDASVMRILQWKKELGLIF